MLASHESSAAVLAGTAADLSGVWWWRKAKEVEGRRLREATKEEKFFIPTGNEVGLSFGNVSYPTAFRLEADLNSKQKTFYKQAGFWQGAAQWLKTIVAGLTFGLLQVDVTEMTKPLEYKPDDIVSLIFPSTALNYAYVERLSSSCKSFALQDESVCFKDNFYLVKLNDDEWLQTNGITGLNDTLVGDTFSAVNVSSWVKEALPVNGVKTSGYVLTRIIHGGSGTPHAFFWGLFTEEVGQKTKIFSWDTDSEERRACSQYFSWAFGICKKLYSEPR